MLSQIAIFAAATALSAGSGQLLPAQSSWWERVDVTLSGNGATQTCEFTASHARAEHCDAVKASVSEAASPASAQLTKLTFERKFIPGDRAPGSVETDVGDTLIAAHMMELSIDASGAVSHCQVIASAGDERPEQLGEMLTWQPVPELEPLTIDLRELFEEAFGDLELGDDD